MRVYHEELGTLAYTQEELLLSCVLPYIAALLARVP
jgi:hypothetical protein